MTSLWKLILCPMMKPVIIKLGDKFKTFLEYFLHKTQKTNSNLFFCMKLKHVREREIRLRCLWTRFPRGLAPLLGNYNIH